MPIPAKLAPMKVSVWTAPHRVEPQRSTRLAAAARSQAGSALLEHAMRSTGLTPWVPERDPRGAPLAHDGWHVSKSHCPEALAAALACQPVGVDIEPIRWSRVAEWDRVVSDEERALLEPFDAFAFTRLWTAKEAVLKADGIGIGGLSGCRLVAVEGPECLVLRQAGVLRPVHQRTWANHVVSVYSEGAQSVSWAHLAPQESPSREPDPPTPAPPE